MQILGLPYTRAGADQPAPTLAGLTHSLAGHPEPGTRTYVATERGLRDDGLGRTCTSDADAHFDPAEARMYVCMYWTAHAHASYILRLRFSWMAGGRAGAVDLALAPGERALGARGEIRALALGWSSLRRRCEAEAEAAGS